MKGPILIVVLALGAACAQAQIVSGQVDTFATDVQGWQGATPTWTSSGGVGDSSYLNLHSTGGFGQSSKMATFNVSQWTGNFTSAGVGAIDVDFNNLGATDLEMRLVLWDPAIATAWVSNNSAVLAAGSGWTHFTYSLSDAFTQVEGTTSFADTLANVGRMMFRNNPGAPSDSGVATVATLGVDNITATPVPEPASMAALGLGVAALIRRRRKTSAL